MAEQIRIYTDGACQGNPGPGGWAAIVQRKGEETELAGHEDGTTNNRMEVMAAIKGLETTLEGSNVTLYSDSQYLVKGMNEWLPGWKAKGWKRKGGPIQNLELWQQLDGVAADQDVRWTWVRGHAGHPKNEYVNDLAVEAAQKLTQSGGLVPSGFQAWLEEQREKKGRYLDYFEFKAPI